MSSEKNENQVISFTGVLGRAEDCEPHIGTPVFIPAAWREQLGFGHDD